MWGKAYLPDDLPRLTSYAEALHRYNTTTPLQKGEDKGLIPLGSNRRYKRSQMLKVDALNGSRIICRYWNHDVISFYQSGAIEFDIGAWHTPTTLMFLNEVLGHKFTRYKGKIYYFHANQYYYLHPVDGLSINADHVPVNPTPEVAKILNKAKLKELRDRFKTFTTYAVDMARVTEPATGPTLMAQFDKLLETYGMDFWVQFSTGNRALTSMPHVNVRTRIPYLTIQGKEIKYNRNNITDTRKAFFKVLTKACETNNLDLMYPLMFMLQASAAMHRWTGSGYIYECTPEQIKKYFYELMKFEYCDYVFDETVQPIGDLVADSNAKYFVTPRTT